jgi:zinc-ribbon domain
MYSLIVFIIIVVISIIFAALIAMTVVSTLVLSGASTPTTTLSMSTFQSFMTVNLANSFIIAVLSGLMWVLALYQLENKKGRTILLVTFVFMILTSTITIINTTRMIDDWRSQGTLNTLFNQSTPSSSSVYSQLLSSTPWTGFTGVILLLCQFLQYLLLFIALYIPYKRINIGELQPILPATQGQKRCPTCGRSIPDDAINCPYCGTQI